MSVLAPAAILGLSQLWFPSVLDAQGHPHPARFVSAELRPQTVRRATGGDHSPSPVRWYHVSAALGSIAALSLLDDAVQRGTQATRTPGGDAAARAFRRMGQPEVYLPVALGTIAVGLLSGDDDITRSGGRIAGSLAVAGLAGNTLKLFVGRNRPTFTTHQYEFKPFSSQASWPSGHTAQAFSLASSVSDELHSVPASLGLYTLASLTGWSRINDNRHWLSDVVSGALIGIVSTKIVNGSWKVAGVEGPEFLQDDVRLGVSLGF
jgi:membrane-associated phospholipid phosphatase